jgi:ketosteroid isomerase-like protein
MRRHPNKGEEKLMTSCGTERLREKRSADGALAPDCDEIARAYFDGLHRKDLSLVPYADDAVMWAPLGPDGAAKPVTGRSAIIQCLQAFFPILHSVEIQNLFAQGEWAAGRAFARLTTPAGAMLRMDDLFRIEDGKIVEQETSWR